MTMDPESYRVLEALAEEASPGTRTELEWQGMYEPNLGPIDARLNGELEGADLEDALKHLDREHYIARTQRDRSKGVTDGVVTSPRHAVTEIELTRKAYKTL